MKRFFLNFFFLIGIFTASSLLVILNALAPKRSILEKTSQKDLSSKKALFDILENFSSENPLTQYKYENEDISHFDSVEEKDPTLLRLLRNDPLSMEKIIEHVFEMHIPSRNQLATLINDATKQDQYLSESILKSYYYRIQHLFLLGFSREASALYNLIKRHHLYHNRYCLIFDLMSINCLKIHKFLEAEELRSSRVTIQYTEEMKTQSIVQKPLYDSLKAGQKISVQFYKRQGFFEFNTHETLKLFLIQMHPIFSKYLQYSEKFPLKIYTPLLEQDANGNVLINLSKIPQALRQIFQFFLERYFVVQFFSSSHLVLKKSSKKLRTEPSKKSLAEKISPPKNFVLLKEKITGAQSGGVYSEKYDNSQIWLLKSADVRGGGKIHSSYAIREVAGAGLLKKMDICIPETKIVLDRKKENLLVGSRYQERISYFEHLHIFNHHHKVNKKPLQKMMLLALFTGHNDFFNSSNRNILFQFNETSQLYEPIMIDFSSIFLPETLKKTIRLLENNSLEKILRSSNLFEGYHYGLKNFIWEGVSQQEMYKIALPLIKELKEILNEEVVNHYFDHELQFENKEKFSLEIAEVKKSFLSYQAMEKAFLENYTTYCLVDNPEKTPEKDLSSQLILNIFKNFDSISSITQYKYDDWNMSYLNSVEEKDLSSLQLLRNDPLSMEKIIKHVFEMYIPLTNQLARFINDATIQGRYLSKSILKSYYYRIQHLFLLGFSREASYLYMKIKIYSILKNTQCIAMDKMCVSCLKIYNILEAEELRSSSFKIPYNEDRKVQSISPNSLRDSLKEDHTISIQFYKEHGFFEFNTHESLTFFLDKINPIFSKYLRYSEKTPLKIYTPLLKQDDNGNILIDLSKIPSTLRQLFYLFWKRFSIIESDSVHTILLEKKIVLKKRAVLQTISEKLHIEVEKGRPQEEISPPKNLILLNGKSLGVQSGGIYVEKADNRNIWLLKSADDRGKGRINSSFALKEVAGAELLKKMHIRIPETKIVPDLKKKNLLVGSRYQEKIFHFDHLHTLNRHNKVNKKSLQKMMLVALFTGHNDFFNSGNGNILFQFDETTQLYEPIMVDLATIFSPQTLNDTIYLLKDNSLKKLLLHSNLFEGYYYGLKNFIWEGVAEQEMYEMALSVRKELNAIFNKEVLNHYFEHELQFENKKKFSLKIATVKKSFLSYQSVEKAFMKNYESNYLIDNRIRILPKDLDQYAERTIYRFSSPLVAQQMIDFCEKYFPHSCQKRSEDSNDVIVHNSIAQSPEFESAFYHFKEGGEWKTFLKIPTDFASFRFMGISIQYNSNNLFFIRFFLKKLLNTQKKVSLKTTHFTTVLSEKDFDKQIKMFSHEKVEAILMDSDNTLFEFLPNEKLLSCA